MKQLLDKQIQFLAEVAQKVDFLDKNQYANWLAQTYYFVRHSTRLLNFSSGLTPFDLQFFHLRANEHAAEERSHEKLLEMDLKSLGFKTTDFLELPATKSFYQCQYFSIQHLHPLSFLGYVMMLETLPITLGPELLQKVESKHGKSACSFLRVHTNEDPEHIKSLLLILEKLDAKVVEYIKGNLEQSTYQYGQILSGITENYAAKNFAA